MLSSLRRAAHVGEQGDREKGLEASNNGDEIGEKQEGGEVARVRGPRKAKKDAPSNDGGKARGEQFGKEQWRVLLEAEKEFVRNLNGGTLPIGANHYSLHEVDGDGNCLLYLSSLGYTWE